MLGFVLVFLAVRHVLTIVSVQATNWEELGINGSYANFLTNTQLLYQELFDTRNYRRDLSPIYSGSGRDQEIPPFSLLVTLQYIQLLGIDAQSQMASISMEVGYQYIDPRLTWNSTKFGGVESINVEWTKIWVPANGISNAQTLEIIYPDQFTTATIASNGTISLSLQIYAETRCVMDVRTFPFDEQICTIDFFNNAYDTEAFALTASKFTKYTQGIIYDNGEWNFRNLTIFHEQFFGVGDVKYEFVQYYLDIQREPTFYVFVIAIPCFLLTLLSIWGMFWTPNTDEEQLSKLSIGLTSMMSMTIFVEMLSNAIPRNASFPLLGWLVIIDVFLVSIACVVLVTLPYDESKISKKGAEARKCIPESYTQNSSSTIDWDDLGVDPDYARFLQKNQELYDELFITRNYRSDLSPIFNQATKNNSIPRFNVMISLEFVQLLGVNAQSQLASTAMEIDYAYTDPRLAWNPENYGGIDMINVESKSIWIPANGISNAQTLQVVYPDPLNTANIYANGSVAVSFQIYAETRCVMDVKNFPFDEQSCTIDIFNNAYTLDMVQETGALFTKYVDGIIFDNGEWKFKNVSMEYFDFSGTGRDKYDFLQFVLNIKRQPNFYVFVIVIPCFLLTLLSIWGMFWTLNNREEQLSKLSIGLTSMMSMTIFVQMLSEEIPRNSSFPLLGWFVIIDVGLVSLACVILVTLPFEKAKNVKKEVDGLEGIRKWSPFLRNWLISRHFFIFFTFQMTNVTNFIVFMSHWN
ncbi:unnamed protein product, partial [Mesorhabditis spiculigera]